MTNFLSFSLITTYSLITEYGLSNEKHNRLLCNINVISMQFTIYHLQMHLHLVDYHYHSHRKEIVILRMKDDSMEKGMKKRMLAWCRLIVNEFLIENIIYYY